MSIKLFEKKIITKSDASVLLRTFLVPLCQNLIEVLRMSPPLKKKSFSAAKFY